MKKCKTHDKISECADCGKKFYLVPTSKENISCENAQEYIVKLASQKVEEECCEKCHDVYFTDDFPMQECLDACINQSCPCHLPTQPTSSNFLQVGRTVECGACKPKFRHCEDIKKEFPDFKCECVCHDQPTSLEEWEIEYEKLSQTGMTTKQFISNLILKERASVRKEIVEIIKKERRLICDCRSENCPRLEVIINSLNQS
jgi:hypothetical protein